VKLPQSPPDATQALQRLWKDASARERLLTTPVDDGRYLHWDELRRRKPPTGLDPAQWWSVLRFQRRLTRRELPFTDGEGRPFTHAAPPSFAEVLHVIDRRLADSLVDPDNAYARGLRAHQLVEVQREEAASSSILEGAATTLVIAKELLRSGRKPANRGERMVVNNFAALEFLRTELVQQPLTPQGVCALHARITQDTLEDPADCGRLRKPDDDVHVVDRTDGTVLYTPPPAAQLPKRLETLCAFTNGATLKEFVHPVVRAMLLHLALASDHPFVDGNGRTARALFYWAMLRQGYTLAEWFSISAIVRRARTQYARAFLYTQTDGSDATDFLRHHLRVLKNALAQIQPGFDDRVHEAASLAKEYGADLNPRQLAVLAHARKHAGATDTVLTHQHDHRIADQAARSDLTNLVAAGLLAVRSEGRTRLYASALGS